MAFLKYTIYIVITVTIVSLIIQYNYQRFDPSLIKGKRVLVTGASSGIGEGLAYQYAKLGANLVLTARRGDLLQTVATKCKKLGAQKVEYIAADMGLPKDRQAVFKKTITSLSGIDQLILNHADVKPEQFFGKPEDVDRLRRRMEVNFMSFVDLTSMFLPALIKSKGNVGVVSALGGKVSSAVLASYCSSKFALQGFYGSFRQELRLRNTGVSITLLVLGAIETEMGRHYAEEVFPGLINQRMMFLFPATVGDTAEIIIKAVTNRVNEVVYPSEAAWSLVFHWLAPQYVEEQASAILFNSQAPELLQEIQPNDDLKTNSHPNEKRDEI